MPSGIDHLVVAAADLDAGAAELEDIVGLVCTAGGRHEGLGTVNRIAFLADGSYVEIMTVEDPAQALAWTIGVATLAALERGGGLAGYALNDDELPITVGVLRAAGSRIGPVTPGARRRTDGEMVRWWTAIAEPLGAEGLPFLIRHARYGGEWGPAAVAARAAIPHPAGSPVRLAGLGLAVPDPEALAALQFRHLGLEYTRIGPAAVCALPDHVIRLLAAGATGPAASIHLRATGERRNVDALGVHWQIAP